MSKERFLFYPGSTEHKRKDLEVFYISCASAIQTLEKDKVKFTDKEKIYEVFLNEKVYLKPKTKSSSDKSFNINREVSLFKRIKLISDEDNEYIKLGSMGKVINDEKNDLKHLNWLQIIIIHYLLQWNYDESTPSLIHIIERVNNQKIDLKQLANECFFNEYRIKQISQHISKLVLEKFDEEILHFLIASGTPNNNKPEKIKRSIIGDIYNFLNDNEINIDDLKNWVVDITKKIELWHGNGDISDRNKLSISYLLGKKVFYEKRKFNIKFLHNKLTIENYKNTLINLLVDFYVENKRKDYVALWKKYISNCCLFKINSNYVEINNIYQEYIENIKNNYFQTSNDFIELDNPKNFLKKLFNDAKIKTIDEKYLNTELLKNILLKNLNEKVWKRGPQPDINDFFGTLDEVDNPTIYEFMSLYLVYVLLFKKDNFEDFIKRINTHLSQEGKPLRFSSSGVPDAIFNYKDENIIIEPTLVTKNIMAHEKRIPEHILESNASFAILIAPSFREEDMNRIIQISTGRDLERRSTPIIPISNKLLVGMLNKNFDWNIDSYINIWTNYYEKGEFENKIKEISKELQV